MSSGSSASGSWFSRATPNDPRTEQQKSEGLKTRRADADSLGVGKSVIGLCAAFGTVVGGYLPVLWGASSFSLASLVFGFAGGVAGVWLRGPAPGPYGRKPA